MFCLLKFSSGAGKSQSPWHPGEPGDCSFLFIPKSDSPAQVWVSAFSQRRSPGLRKSWAATVYSPQASTHLSPAFPSPASYQTKLTAAVSERLGVRVPMHTSGRGAAQQKATAGNCGLTRSEESWARDWHHCSILLVQCVTAQILCSHAFKTIPRNDRGEQFGEHW